MHVAGRSATTRAGAGSSDQRGIVPLPIQNSASGTGGESEQRGLPLSMRGSRSIVGRVVSSLAAFLSAAVALGLLAAGLLVPIVGGAGAAARSGVDLFDSLPSEFTASPLSQQSRILAGDGSLIATPFDENRIIVPMREVAPIMRAAQVAIEDSRFYEHGGVDPRGVVRALVSNVVGANTQGASTLTQQYVKVTLQENALSSGDTDAAKAAVAKSFTRKLQELKYAIQVEKSLTKDQILENYLNLVYYGNRAYGVEAASHHYFNKSAKELTLPEAALIAGLAQNPGTTDPVNQPDRAVARQRVVLDRMLELGIVTRAEVEAAKAVPLAQLVHVTPPKNTCQSSPYPYFCDYVLAWLKTDPSLSGVLGQTEQERTRALDRGGLTIQTTLSPAIQTVAQEELERRVPVANDADIGSASVVMEPGTGQVRAMAQNTRYNLAKGKPGETTVNWAVDTKYGGSLGFGFGSTEKAFALVTALQSGISASASVHAKAAGPREAAEYTGAEFPDDCGLGKKTWNVRNDEPVAEGDMTLRDATARSINTAFVGLVSKLGACKVRETEWRMGLHQSNGEKVKPFPAAIVLGTDSVSPMTVAAAYGTLAAEGRHCAPLPVVSIAKDGKPLPLPPPGANCEQRVDPDVARGVTSIMSDVLGPKGTASASALAGGRPAAGKTGTTDGNNETWFVGFTPQLATAVWVGTPDDKNNARVLDNVRLAGQSYGTVFGASIAAPVWKAIMDRALQGQPPVPFAAPSDKILNGEQIPVPSVGGRSVEDARGILEQAGFSVQVGPEQFSGYRAGAVATTDPTGIAARGSVVSLVISTGPAPAPPPPPAPAPVPVPAPPPPPPPVPAPRPAPAPAPRPAPAPAPRPAPAPAPRPAPAPAPRPAPPPVPPVPVPPVPVPPVPVPPVPVPPVPVPAPPPPPPPPPPRATNPPPPVVPRPGPPPPTFPDFPGFPTVPPPPG